MPDEKASIKISLRDGQFEIAGSESFVSGSIELLRDIILASHANLIDEEKVTLENQTSTPPEEAPHQTTGSAKRFLNVLHIEGDKVSIIKTLPAGNNSEKTVKAALLYLWGKKQAGIDAVNINEIREVCKSLSCFDSANFSATIQGARSNFIVEGKKGSQSKMCKLTIPGVEAAVKLLETMNA